MRTHDDAAATRGVTLRVTGMTCPACERRVRKALSALPGVGSVTASATHGRAVLTLDGPPPSDEAVRGALAAAGYTVGAPPWITRDRRAWAVTAVAALALGTALWVAARAGLDAPSPDAGSGGTVAGLGLALLVGLAAGVSTCMALVGGLVLGISAGSAKTTGSTASGSKASGSGTPGAGAALRPHLVFTAGRLAGFGAGGALLGAVGSAARLPAPAVAVATVVAALVMALLGVRLTGLSPRLSGWALTLPGRRGDLGLHHDRGLLAAGAATFLLPCGFTQAMQLYAISLGSPVRSAATMVAFALGTVPGLLGLGALGSLSGRRGRAGQARGTRSPRSGTPGTEQAGRPATAIRLVGVVVLAFAVVTGTGGLNALGVAVPSLPGSGAPELASGTVSPNVRLDGDVQVVSMTQTAHGYSPAHTTVWAGVPIRWSIDVTAGFSCSAFLRVPSVGVSADLTREGPTIVQVPALKAGTTRFACVMGMYKGTFRAVPRPAETPSAAAAATR